MGILVDPSRAQTYPCTCYRIGTGDRPEDVMCFVPGIIGTLSDEQDKIYCPPEKRIVNPPTKEFGRHIQKFKLLGKIMDICAEKELKDFLSCLRDEAEKLMLG